MDRNDGRRGGRYMETNGRSQCQRDLARMVREKTITGGVFVGERADCFIIDCKSIEELGQIIRDLPFWPRLKWNVRALESFESVNALERKIFEHLEPSEYIA